MAASDLLGLLEAGDVDACRAHWAKHAPHLPQSENREQAEIVMHSARTMTQGLTLRARAYSHRWLCERGLPSSLPDDLKPKAERIYPRVVEGVLISVLNGAGPMHAAKELVEADIAEVVADAYARGKTDPAYISGLMADAKERSIRSLFGRPVSA